MSAPSPAPAAYARSRVTVALAGVAVLLAAVGAYGLVRADHGLTVRQVTVAGVPLTEVRAGPPTAPRSRPGVLVAHGFAGSARLMRPIADTVARTGAVALLLDFAGHGANPSRLADVRRDGPDDALASDLDVAVAHLRSRPDVDPARLVLVGHSMGAGAVTRWAAAHPEVVRTVAISLPDAGDLPDGRPAGLLLIVGGAEFGGFREAAGEAARNGPDRRLVVVPGVEHISVLFAGRTHDEIAGWLPPADTDGAGERPGTDGAGEPTARLAAAGLLLLGVGLGFVPLSVLLLGRRRARPGPPAPPAPLLVAVVLAAVGAGAVVAAVLPTTRLPLAVGGHVTGFLLVTGVLLAAAARWAAGRAGPPPAAPAGHRSSGRIVVAAAVLTGYAVLAVAVPLHLGFTSALPVGARWWLLPVVAVGCFAFLHGVELVSAGHGGRHALTGAVAVLALTASAVVGLAPGFLLLVVPLFVVLLAWQAAWAAVLRRTAAPRWLPALTGSAVLAWPVATTLPLG